MADDKVVLDVNSELSRLLEESRTQKDHPRLTRVIELLFALTHDDDEAAHAVISGTAQESPDGESKSTAGPVVVAAKAAKPDACQHPNLNNWGKCLVCGECLHTNVKGGWCLTCNAEMPPQET